MTNKEFPLSLIICTYEWPAALDLCLRAVLKQTVMPTEVIVADDGSKAPTAELIASYQAKFPVPLIHVWQEDEGFRLATIRNKAILKASTPYIVQIDGDIIPNRHFIEDHIAVAEKGCFIRGTRSRLTKEKSEELFASKETDLHFYSPGVENRFNAVRIPFLSFLAAKKKKSGNKVKGCNRAFWKEDLVRANGYSNDLKGWGHEDEELSWRLINAGLLKKVVKLRAVIYHIHHNEASKSDEHKHHSMLDEVIEKKLTTTTNGLKELQ